MTKNCIIMYSKIWFFSFKFNNRPSINIIFQVTDFWGKNNSKSSEIAIWIDVVVKVRLKNLYCCMRLVALMHSKILMYSTVSKCSIISRCLTYMTNFFFCIISNKGDKAQLYHQSLLQSIYTRYLIFICIDSNSF